MKIIGTYILLVNAIMIFIKNIKIIWKILFALVWKEMTRFGIGAIFLYFRYEFLTYNIFRYSFWQFRKEKKKIKSTLRFIYK